MDHRMNTSRKDRQKSFYFQKRAETKILHLSLLAFTDITLAKTLNKRYACIKNFDIITRRNYLTKRKIILQRKILKNICDDKSVFLTRTKKYRIKRNPKTFITPDAKRYDKNCDESRKLFINKKTRQFLRPVNLNLVKKKAVNEEEHAIKKLNLKKEFKIETKDFNFSKIKQFETDKKIIGIKKISKNTKQNNLQSKNIQESKILKLKLNNFHVEKSLSKNEEIEKKIDNDEKKEYLNRIVEIDLKNNSTQTSLETLAENKKDGFVLKNDSTQTNLETFSENKKDGFVLKNDSTQTSLETFSENKKDGFVLKNDSTQTSLETFSENNYFSNTNSRKKENVINNMNNLNDENNLSKNETKIYDQEIKESPSLTEKIDSKVKKISLELSAEDDLNLNSRRKMSEKKELVNNFSNQTKKESRLSLLDNEIKNENKNQEVKIQNEKINEREDNYEKTSNPKNSQSLNQNLILNQNEEFFDRKFFFSNVSNNKNLIQLEKNKDSEDENVVIAKNSINFSKEFLTKENVMNLLNLDDNQERNSPEIRNSLKLSSKNTEENTQKTKFSLIKQIKLSLNRKNSEKKSSLKILKNSSISKNSSDEKNDENKKVNKSEHQDNLDLIPNEIDQKNTVENLSESNNKKKSIQIDKESEINEQKTSINSVEKQNFSKSLLNEQIFEENLKESEEKPNKNKESLTNFELNFNSNPNTAESDILVSCQVFYSDKKSKEIDDLKFKKKLSFDQNQDFLFLPEPEEAIEKVKKNRLIYQVAELNSIDFEILNEQALDTFTEIARENLSKNLIKAESTTQLQSRIVQVNNCFASKDEALFSFQNDFLDESYDIENQIDQELELIKSNRSSFEEQEKVVQQEDNTKVQSVSSFISENEIILSEIEKKSQVFHSKNYYHLIDKNDLDQSDDQSNFRSSEIFDRINKSKTIDYNRDSSRLSYSSLNLSKNFDKKSATSILSEKSTLTKNKSLSVDTLFKRPSKFSNNSVYDSIHFYCLLKYRIKHLLKIK